MTVRFWGVRGSIPSPGERTCRVGGNTSCIQITCNNETVIFDAGTGIRELGLSMDSEPEGRRIHLFVTHTHWDHIQGLPFFRALYKRDNEVVIYGPRGLDRGLEDAVMVQMQRLWFPVRRGELSARVSFTELGEETFSVGPMVISTKLMNHPVLSLAYSVMHGGKRVVYTGDNEPFTFCHVYNPATEATMKLGISEAERVKKYKTLVDFVSGADLLIADSQYTDEEYASKIGWGHSPISYTVDLAVSSQVKTLALFHHDPGHSDEQLEKFEAKARELAAQRKAACKILLAREGLSLDL